MTRVQGPLFSITASGTIGDALTYSNWKGLPYVRFRCIPANPKTADQVSARCCLTAGVSIWHDVVSVPAVSKNSWDYYASGTGMSGFNRFIKKFIESNSPCESPYTVPTPGVTIPC